MEGELKRIKKLYGENFAKLCRTLFSRILDNEGKLLEILLQNFARVFIFFNSKYFVNNL